jgi:hypothetical protein
VIVVTSPARVRRDAEVADADDRRWPVREEQMTQSAIVQLAVVAALAGCQAHQIRRSALVPAVTPPLSAGAVSNDRLVGLTVGNSTFLRATSPIEPSSTTQNAGLYIPRTQFGLEALFTVAENLRLGPKLEIGLREGATPIARDIPPPPDNPVVGFGPVIEYAIPVHPLVRIGMGVELLWTFAPYAIYEGCPVCRRTDQGADSTLVLGLSLIPAVRLGPVVVFAGISGRNQPTNTRDATVYGSVDFSDNVTFGKMYLVTFGGLEVHIGRYLDVALQLYYPVNRDPVSYGGPALSAWLTLPLGDGPEQRTTRQRHYHRQTPALVPAPTPPAPIYVPPAPMPPPAAPAPLPGSPSSGPEEI